MPVTIIEMRVRRMESRTSPVSLERKGKVSKVSRRYSQERRTKNEFFSWRKHVHGEGHLILVYLQPNPAHQRIDDIEEESHG